MLESRIYVMDFGVRRRQMGSSVALLGEAKLCALESGLCMSQRLKAPIHNQDDVSALFGELLALRALSCRTSPAALSYDDLLVLPPFTDVPTPRFWALE